MLLLDSYLIFHPYHPIQPHLNNVSPAHPFWWPLPLVHHQIISLDPWPVNRQPYPLLILTRSSVFLTTPASPTAHVGVTIVPF
jgi:hypothetical protein